MISCIYSITNLVNGKMYIGQTRNYKQRKSEHITSLRANKSPNPYLQNSFNKYGEHNFQFTIIEECESSMLNDREVYWIKRLQTTNKNIGYNIQSGGNHFETYGRDTSYLTEEFKKNISNKRKEYYTNHRPYNYGAKRPKELVEKINKIRLENRVPGELQPTSRRIVCLRTLNIFDSMKQCSDFYGVCFTGIIENVNGNKRYVLINKIPYIFVSFEKFMSMSREEIRKTLKEAEDYYSVKFHGDWNKPVMCIETEKAYSSAAECGRDMGIDKSIICKCCKIQGKKAGHTKGGPYTFKYI